MRRNYKISGLDCANCAMKLERMVSKVKGVNEAKINFMTQKLVLDIADGNFEEILLEVNKLIGRFDKGITITGC